MPLRRRNRNSGYSVAEVAEMLGVGKETVYRAIKDGKIPFFRDGNRHKRVYKKDLKDIEIRPSPNGKGQGIFLRDSGSGESEISETSQKEEEPRVPSPDSTEALIDIKINHDRIQQMMEMAVDVALKDFQKNFLGRVLEIELEMQRLRTTVQEKSDVLEEVEVAIEKLRSEVQEESLDMDEVTSAVFGKLQSRLLS